MILKYLVIEFGTFKTLFETTNLDEAKSYMNFQKRRKVDCYIRTTPL